MMSLTERRRSELSFGQYQQNDLIIKSCWVTSRTFRRFSFWRESTMSCEIALRGDRLRKRISDLRRRTCKVQAPRMFHSSSMWSNSSEKFANVTTCDYRKRNCCRRQVKIPRAYTLMQSRFERFPSSLHWFSNLTFCIVCFAWRLIGFFGQSIPYVCCCCCCLSLDCARRRQWRNLTLLSAC